MKAIGYVVSFGVFLLGLFLMGLAFEITAFQPETFFLGLLAMCAGFFIPIHILPRINGR
jgi:hypothetical protein